SGDSWWGWGYVGGFADSVLGAPVRAVSAAASNIKNSVVSTTQKVWNYGSEIIENAQAKILSIANPVTWTTAVPLTVLRTASNVATPVIQAVDNIDKAAKAVLQPPGPPPPPPPPQPAQPAPPPKPVAPTPTTNPTKTWDRLIPFVALAPATVAISIFSYLIWKYFAQLRKIRLYRRAPLRIPGPSVQEQLLDHVEEAGPHEYQLVKERKPPSVPARTKRSARDPAGGGRVNRRTIIKIHFELVDECQKGNTKLTQKDFLELLVREFMGSEFMEEEQVPKEEVLMEGVLMEGVLMERVPILGSVFMV
ncbi:SICAvar, type I (fragment), partial [Plasmodium knowlesi strain H]